MARFSLRLLLRTVVVCLLELQSLAARTRGGVRSNSRRGGSSSLSTGAIVGIVLGGLVGPIVLVIALILIKIYCCRKEKRSPVNLVNSTTVPVSNIDSNLYSRTNNAFLADEVNYNEVKPPPYEEMPRSTYPI